MAAQATADLRKFQNEDCCLQKSAGLWTTAGSPQGYRNYEKVQVVLMASGFDSLFGAIFGDAKLRPPEPELPDAYLRALRCAANAWLKEHSQHPQAALVQAALVATNPRSQS